MGAILAKFRKEKSTEEVLENLQEKIDAFELFTLDTQEQKKRVVGNFLATSIGLYIIAFAVFYFLYFPPTWRERFIYFIPLILFPFVIILLRRLFAWYYQRKLNKNSKKLTALRAEKKKILEQVMDKETYKVAVSILAKFADKPTSSNRTQLSALNSSLRTPIKSNQLALNRSLPAPSTTTAVKPITKTMTPPLPTLRTGQNTNISNLSMQAVYGSTPRSTLTSLATPTYNNNQVLRRRTPFPVIDQQSKGVFEKIVDVLIGDGPGDRFAMICKDCFAHNGMALKDDFEYTTFRCAFCNALNPARKARPAGPRLSNMPVPQPVDSSSDEKEDTDDEISPINTTRASDLFTPLIAAAMASNARNATSTSSSSEDEHQHTAETLADNPTEENQEVCRESESNVENLPQTETENLEKSDSAIDDVSMSTEEH